MSLHPKTAKLPKKWSLMSTSATSPLLSCRECKSPFTAEGERTPHHACCDNVCKKCAQAIFKAMLNNTTPDQEQAEIRIQCSQCDGSSIRENLPLIAALEKIKQLEQERFRSASSATSSHASSSASSSCASSSVDSSYDSSLYDPVKPAHQDDDMWTKIGHFEEDKTGNMDLHGLTSEDIDELLTSDRGAAVMLFKEIHKKIRDYHTDKVLLENKFHPDSESYRKYLAMIRLAANVNAVNAQIGWAAYYLVLGIEKGLFKEYKEDYRKKVDPILAENRDTGFTVNCELARDELQSLMKIPSLSTPLGKPSNASSEPHSLLEKAKCFLSQANNISLRDETIDKLKPFTNLSLSNDPLVARMGWALYDKLNFMIGLFEGRFINFEICNLAIHARRGDPEAICILLEFFSQKISEKHPKSESLISELKEKLVIAANQGHATACTLLGLYHLRGILGFENNISKAMEYLRLGSARGNPYASLWLAQLLRQESSIRNRAEVKTFFKKALKGGIDCSKEFNAFKEGRESWVGLPDRASCYQFFLSK